MTQATPSQGIQPTSEAILRTLLYADIFDYPMTPGEIHHYLIGHPATRRQVEEALAASDWLAGRVERVNGYYATQGRAGAAQLRRSRAEASARLWPQARRHARIIGCLPFVRMVAVTGALAMDNALAGDDADYIVVTLPGRVWLARLLVVALVRLVRVWGVGLCPNYVLSASALAQPRRDLFIARELAQMVPIVGHDVYRAMRAANAWADAQLPNAGGPFRPEADGAPRGLWRTLQRALEWALGGRLGDWLETWERRRKIARFRELASSPRSSAILDEQHVKGHFEDYGAPTLEAYARRLAVSGIMPGDAPSGNGRVH